MTSQLYSQKSSSNCTVPCYTLRNAVKTKYELESANIKISGLRDSIRVVEKVILQQDSLLLNNQIEIKNLNTEVKCRDSIIKEDKDRSNFYKSEYDKQVRNKWVAIIVGSITTICSLIFF